MDNIDRDQLSEPPKKVGTVKGKPVYHLRCKGGLHVHAFSKSGKMEIVGSGSHRAISMNIAERKEPDIEWTELSKSEWIPLDAYEHLLPKYEAMTDELRNLLANK